MLQGKTAVVTGSTSGIGLGIAEALAREGCNVALNSYTDTDEDRAIAAIGRSGLQSFVLQRIIVSPFYCTAI